MFVRLGLAELTNDAIELVLAGERVTLFHPFVDGDDGAAFGEDKAQKPPTQRVSTSGGGGDGGRGSGSAFSCGLRRKVAGDGQVAAERAEQHCLFTQLRHYHWIRIEFLKPRNWK